MAGDYPALHRLENTIQPLGANLTGPFFMTVQGTVNTVGGGTGGTSSTDESTFTTGGTSLTPAGALVGTFGADPTMSMGGARIGAPKMSGQRIPFMAIATPSGGDVMDNTNTAVRVNVVAGGAGGGVANITVRGTANTDLHVGVASLANAPQADGAMYLPILGTVNLGAGAAPFATVGVYGSPAFPIYNIGSVNVVNAVGVFGSVTGIATVNMGNIPTVNLGLGTINVGNIAAVTVGSVPMSTISLLGTAGATAYRAGVASNNVGAWPNYDGGAWLPVFYPSGFYPTVNIAGAVGIFGSLAGGSLNVLAGQAGAPWSIIGSVNITGSINPVGVFGSMSVVGSVNITGSINPVGVFGSLSVVGSVNTTPLGVQVVDTRGSLVPTQWMISFGGSGVSQVAAAAPANQRIWLSSFHLTSTGTIDLAWQSPSGIAISGSMRVLPGAGFAFAGAMPNSPVVLGSLNSPLFLAAAGTQNVGGLAVGWIA